MDDDREQPPLLSDPRILAFIVTVVIGAVAAAGYYFAIVVPRTHRTQQAVEQIHEQEGVRSTSEQFRALCLETNEQKFKSDWAKACDEIQLPRACTLAQSLAEQMNAERRAADDECYRLYHE